MLHDSETTSEELTTFPTAFTPSLITGTMCCVDANMNTKATVYELFCKKCMGSTGSFHTIQKVFCQGWKGDFCRRCISMRNQASKHTRRKYHWASIDNAKGSSASLSELNHMLLHDWLTQLASRGLGLEHIVWLQEVLTLGKSEFLPRGSL